MHPEQEVGIFPAGRFHRPVWQLRFRVSRGMHITEVPPEITRERQPDLAIRICHAAGAGWPEWVNRRVRL